MDILILIDKGNITYEIYINNPKSMIERPTNINIAKNPSLINSFDRNRNHPFFRKYSLILLLTYKCI